MLGTISFTRSHMLPPEAVAAGLLDLIRQGYVKEVESNQFTLVHQQNATKQEHILIEWLFEKVGDGHSFSLQQLEAFAKKINKITKPIKAMIKNGKRQSGKK